MKLPQPRLNFLGSSKSRWHSINVLGKSPQIWRRDFESQKQSSRDKEAGTCLVTSLITCPSRWRFLAKNWILAPNSAYCFAEQDRSGLAVVLHLCCTIWGGVRCAGLARSFQGELRRHKPVFFAFEKPSSQRCHAVLPSLSIIPVFYSKDMTSVMTWPRSRA